jgi:hypothetical protein
MNTDTKVLQEQLTHEIFQCRINYAKIVLKNFHNDLIEHELDKKEIKLVMEKINNLIFKNDLKC